MPAQIRIKQAALFKGNKHLNTLLKEIPKNSVKRNFLWANTPYGTSLPFKLVNESF